MKIDPADFRVPPKTKVALKDWPTRRKPYYRDKPQYKKVLADHVDRLRKQQSMLYAHDRYALLILFQAMDAAGKDSAIEHVMSGVNPQGCQVFSFKHPGPEALEHDFLWRTTRRLPERGRIGIFNRSYYEEVLIVRVHKEILDNQKLPEAVQNERHFWRNRYRSIVDCERHLHDNGTRIVKFFLHVSKEEQRRRFLDRIDNPDKNWKFSAADLAERALWKDYEKAYEHCLGATSTDFAPWHVVPADDKKNARLIISATILEALEALPLRYPEPSREHLDDLRAARASLMSEKD